ncbi:Ger(x)C family spore germination protein [Paenibacillus glycinis]|uniref:Ger(X)C family spore germination protein n=1 Tax=Paenibacillus glycinis TaxID=2697035 RepID=A0ABW9XKR8_9BACL|nr:Ger(x)C family spore germination protein [Paenibacillus glycinis]NBD23198.1 Ger(x)C family spore germination protein [Paenibacillus glycinis]
MRTKLLLGMLTLSAMLLAGCGNANIVNRIRILVAVGFDRDGELCKGTVAYPNYIHRKGSLAIMKGTGNDPKLILQHLSLQTPRKIRYNKINTIVFSREIAAGGITRLIDTVARDPSLGGNVLLAVSSCSAEKVINSLDRQELENSPYNVVQQNIRDGNVPLSNLYLFLHDYYSEGKDPSMPSLRLDAERQIEVDGYALFKKERLRLVLDTPEMTLFEILLGKKVKGEVPFTYKGELFVMSIHHGSTRLSANMRAVPAAARFEVRLNGGIRSFQGNRIAKNLFEVDDLAASIEHQLMEKLVALLKKIQANGIDSVGVGEEFRSVDRHWNAAEFYRNVYPAMKFDVRVKATLKNSGAGE